MNPVADAIDPNVRRAALALHALAPADRAWVFERLGEPQRAALQPLLAELVELGIPPDTQLVRLALAQNEGGKPAVAEPLPDFDPARLLQVIQAEPAAVRPLLLAVLNPRQREALRAQGLSDTEPAPRALAPALHASLLRAVQERAGAPGAAA